MAETTTLFGLGGGEVDGVTCHEAYVVGNFLVQRRDGPDGPVIAVLGELVRPLFVRMSYSGKLLNEPIEADLRVGEDFPGTIKQVIWLMERVRKNRKLCRFFPFLKDFATHTRERIAAEVIPVSEESTPAVAEAVAKAYKCGTQYVVFDR